MARANMISPVGSRLVATLTSIAMAEKLNALAAMYSTPRESFTARAYPGRRTCAAAAACAAHDRAALYELDASAHAPSRRSAPCEHAVAQRSRAAHGRACARRSTIATREMQ